MKFLTPCRHTSRSGFLGMALLLCLGLSLLAGSARAAQGVFLLGGKVVALSEITNNEAQVFFQSMRFNKAIPAWTVDAWVTNRSTRPIHGPMVLRVDGFTGTSGPLQPDGFDATPLPYYDLSSGLTDGILAPGGATPIRTLTLGVSTGVPSLTTRLFELPTAPREGLALVRSLNEVGQPLPGVVVLDVGTTSARITDASFGVATLDGIEGTHTWKFSREGFLPVWRTAVLKPEAVTVAPSPRLTPRGSSKASFTPFGGGELADEKRSLVSRFPAAAFGSVTAATLTPLTAQTLPALLPRGWSPLQAFWIELAASPSQAGSAQIIPWGLISKSESAVFARWSEDRLQWEASQNVPGNGTNAVTVAMPGSGAYALVVADLPPQSPPSAEIGKPLGGSVVTDPDPSQLTAGGMVEPSSSPASRSAADVTANAALTLRGPSGALVSGLILRGEVHETYRMRDGQLRITPGYENSVAGYQRPGDADPSTLQAGFPMRPLLLLGSEELDTGLVQMDVLPPTPFAGGVMDATGGLVSSGGVRILAGAGDLPGVRAIEIRSLATTNFTGFSTNGISIVRAFDFIAEGTVPGRKFGVQFDGLPTNAWYVLARVISRAGLYGLEPRERLASDSQGRLTSLEPTSPPNLSGVDGAGQYILAQVTAKQGLITGIARGSGGAPSGGLPVSTPPAPWLTFSEPNGGYRLIAPTGAVQLVVRDLNTGDTGQSTATVLRDDAPVQTEIAALNLGPEASLLTPTNAAASVPRVTSVVVGFSRPINPGSLGADGIQLIGPDNLRIQAGLTLDLRNTTATLVPLGQLAPLTRYLVQISPGLTDMNGRALTGANQFSFTTETDALNRVGAQLITYEPTNGLAPVYGTPGAAEPDSAVILVNETTGSTSTVRSRADGSFTNVIEADVDDLLSAVLVNRNGTRTTLPASRQIFRDGSVGLFNGGGILEAESDGGPVQVIVEPGSVPQKTLFGVQAIPLGQVMGFVNGVQPEGGRVLGGIRLAEKGDELKNSPHLQFPVDLASLGVPPGKTPEQMTFALTVPHEYDGVVVYEIVDGMNYENGKLVTHSPPFPGVDVRGLIRRAADTLRGKDTLQDKVDEATQAFGKAVGLLLAPIVMASGEPTTLLGRVYSVATDPSTGKAKLLAVQKPVVGAVVTVVRDNAVHDTAGRLQPGQYVAISDVEGLVALRVPSETPNDPSGFLLQGTHPRFPDQAPVATLTRAGGTQVPFARFSLPFAELDIIGYQGADILSPIISVAQTPQDALAGNGLQGGAVLTVTAIDDRKVTSLNATITSVVPLTLYPPPDLSSLVVLTNHLDIQPATYATGLEKVYGLRSPAKARVTVHVTATDGSGNRSQLDQDILFSRDAGTPPPITSAGDDTNAPSILFVWPPNGATGVNPGEPIRLRFSEPVSLPGNSGAVAFTTQHKVSGSVLSPDGRELTLTYTGPLGGQVKYGVGRITDRAGNALRNGLTVTFDQSSNTVVSLPELQNGGGIVQKGSFAYALERNGDYGKLRVYDLGNPAAPVTAGSLDLPSYPRDIALMPAYPYKLHTSDAQCVTNDLVAIIGGKVGAPTTEEGTFFEGQYLWLINVSDPSHPEVVSKAKAIITYAIAAATKLRWVPPHLAYLEAGADGSAVGFINVQSFLIGQNATPAERQTFPAAGFEGLDTTVTNGCYCDPGEQVSLPARDPADFFGKEYSFLPPISSAGLQPYVVDFDFENRLGLLGMIINGDPAGTLLGDPPQYQTVYSGAGFLNPEATSYKFNRTDALRRLFLMTGVELKQFSSAQGGSYTKATRNLALVSLQTEQGGTCLATNVIYPGELSSRNGTEECPLEIWGRLEIPTNATLQVRNTVVVQPGGSILNWEHLSVTSFINRSTNHYSPTYVDAARYTRRAEAIAVLDITDPASPSLVNTLFFPEKLSGSPPSDVGRVESIQRRADGLLAVATDQHVFLLDPTLLGLAQRPGDVAAWPPAVQGAIPGSGSGARAFESDSTGVNLVNLGGKHQVLRTAPFIDIISFGNRPITRLISPPEVATSNEVYKADLLRSSISPTLLLKSRFAISTAVSPGGSPGSVEVTVPPNTYHVRVDAPGDAGPELSLVMETLDPRGAEPARHGTNGMPSILATAGTLAAIGDTNLTAFPTTLRAYRLSNDRKSDLYNVYLSDPVLLMSQSLKPDQLAVLQGVARTQIRLLKAGKYVWAGIDPSMAGNPIVGAYASKAVQDHLIPGRAVLKVGEKERPPLVFIPGMAASRIADLIDFPTQDTGFPGDELRAVQDFATRYLNVDICTERWPGILFGRKDRLSRSPYDRSRFPGGNFPAMSAYDVMRYIPEIGCGNLSALKDQVVYGSMLKRLKQDEGYTELLYTNRLLSAYNIFISSQRHCADAPEGYFASPAPNLFVFPYDWRFDNTNTLRELTNLIMGVVRRYNPEADKVNLIGHSMGGLLARRFALEHPELVEKVITLGTPWLGSPKAINVMETGDFEIPEFIVDQAILKRLVEFFPSAHQLLPTQSYFGFGTNAFPLAELGYDLDGDGTNSSLLNFEQYRRMMDARCHCDPASRPIANANTPFHSFANADGAAQDDWRSDTSPVQYYHLYGVQRAPLTINRMVAAGRMRQVIQTTNDLRLDMPEKFRKPNEAAALHPVTEWMRATNYWILSLEYLTERGAGDKTVSELSLTRSNAVQNLNRRDAKLAGFFSPDFTHDSEVEHTGLLGTRRAQDAVLDALADVDPVGDSRPPGDVATFSVRVAGLRPGTQEIENPFGRAAKVDFRQSYLGDALNHIQSLASALPGDIMALIQRAAGVATDALNSAIPPLNGVDLTPVGGDVTEVEFVSGVDTTLRFVTGRNPVAIRAVQKASAAPIQSWTWDGLPVPPGTKMELKISGGTVAYLHDESGADYAASLTRAEDGTLDYAIPTLSYRIQEEGQTTNLVFSWTNPTPITRTENVVFVAEDVDGNGTPQDDKWLPLTGTPPVLNATNVLRPGARLYAIVRNDSGNLSQPIKLTYGSSQAADTCRLFDQEKTAVLEIIAEAKQDSLTRGFLLNPLHMALLEQGSGACLWTPNPCVACNGAYTPGRSDHDFELFLPLTVDAADPAHHLPLTSANAYQQRVLEGNWYHRGPVNPNGPAPYLYKLPTGFENLAPNGTVEWNGVLAAGDYPAVEAHPDTPAQIISKLFDRVRSHPRFLPILPDVSFFPERRDSFESGIAHLNRPPNEGDDPLGDAGHGRQMLLLKWVLEGRWVPGYEGLDLGQIYTNMQGQVFSSGSTSQNGIPPVEGYEWGVLQEHTALKSGILLRAVDMVDPAEPNPQAKNFLYDTFIGQIKKAGKGAIRSTLADIVGRAGSSVTNLFITRSHYTNSNYKTFEDYISDMAKTQFSSLFSAAELSLIERSAKAKVAEKEFVRNLLADECLANQYLADALNFIRRVQRDTAPTRDIYLHYLETNGLPGALEEFTSRNDNIGFLESRVTNPPSRSDLLHHAALDIVLRTFNLGPDTLNEVDTRMWVDGEVHASTTNTLAPFKVSYSQGQHYAIPSRGITPFFVEEEVIPSHYGQPHTVDIVVSAAGAAPPGGDPPGGTEPPYKTEWEPNGCNNWIRFRYYLFDPQNPCPNVPFVTIPVPPNIKCSTSDICPGRRNQR